MRFLHTSDWQLGKPFGRFSPDARAALQEARLDAIDSLAAAARHNGVSRVLVAGDVFDSSEPGDRVYRQALTRLKAAEDVDWLLLPGNHDPARADGLWTRLVAEAPANVTACLEPTPIDLGDDVWLLPAPLQYKRTQDDPTAWFDSAVTPPGAVRLGIAHGSVTSFGGPDTPSNLLPPDRAKRSGLAYLALGDWHGRLTIDAFTHYSGTPEADDFGREVTGVALCVEARGPDTPPTVTDIGIGRYHWALADWTVSAAAEIDGLLASLTADVALSNLIARLKISGLLSLGERVAIRTRLERFTDEIRSLDVDLENLQARPTDQDLSDIDLGGVLRSAAEQLQAMAAQQGSGGRRAAAALERLYVEHQRSQKSGTA